MRNCGRMYESGHENRFAFRRRPGGETSTAPKDGANKQGDYE